MHRPFLPIVCAGALALLPLAAAPGPPARGAAIRTALQRELQHELQAMVREWEIPGASLAVRMPDGQVLTAAAGWADREARTPMVPAHRLFTGSIGKTVVAALVLREAARGRLALDERLSKHLGSEPWFSRLPNAEAITLRQLLDHSAGVPEYVAKEAVWKTLAAEPDKVWTPEERLWNILGDPAPFPAGEGFAYADSHYILLGMVLERCTGMSLDRQERRLMKALGLKATLLADRRDLPGLAAGYSSLPPAFHMPAQVLREGRYAFNPQLEWAGGGFVSTAADLTRWGAALFDGAVLPAAWRQRMVTPSPLRTDFPDSARYGLGVILWETEHGPVWGHSGFVPGFNAVLQHVSRHHITLGLLCNSDIALKGPGRSPHAAAQRLLRTVLPAPTTEPPHPPPPPLP